MLDRIVTLVDMDCFYCQVEARLNPSLQGKPMAVVQYNQWKGGGIIAVNYEARDFGVTRSMRGDEAKKKCPDIVLVHVPAVRGKADLTKYRDAGREVVDVLCQFSDCVQRASVDEAYIDITRTIEQRMATLPRVEPEQLPATYVVGFSDVGSNDEDERLQGLTSWLESVYELQDETQIKLAVAAVVVEEMRAAVYKQTGFRCSAGIAHNKILGKLACGLHKPNRQTLLPQSGVLELYKTLPVKKVRNLGGKFGCVVEEQLGCAVMADLLRFSEQQLQQRFDEKTGTWLYNIARGIDHEPVTPRLVSKSIGCCKKFPGKQALATRADVEYWLGELAAEVSERLMKDLEENKRRAKLLTVSYLQDSSCSRSGPLTSYEVSRIVADAYELIKKSNSGSQDSWFPPLKYLGLSVGKFVDESSNQNSTLLNFFKTAQKPADTSDNEIRNGECHESNQTSKKNEEVNPNVRDGTSLKNSFFMRYLKQKAAAKPVETTHDSNSDDDMFEDKSETSTVHVETVSDVNAGATTSRIETDDDNLCVSLTEIFPDLDEVDDSVVELLPAPLQERLRDRVENRNLRHSGSSAGITPQPVNARKKNSGCRVPETDCQHDPPAAAVQCRKKGKENNSVNRGILLEDLDAITVCSEDSREPQNDTVSVPVEKCPDCGQVIPLSEYLEHLDFHAAQRLHQELNRAPQPVVTHKTAIVEVPTKRKRGRPSKANSDKKLRSITAFFTPK